MEESTIAAAESFELDAAGQASKSFFDRAKEFLRPYAKRTFSELEAKELIHQAGIQTFPRPKGIPDNFYVTLSDDGIGLIYRDPNNVHRSVRVMPGIPHSPNSCQQKPYVVQIKDGMAIDKFGNRVGHKTPEAHISIEEFVYRKK